MAQANTSDLFRAYNADSVKHAIRTHNRLRQKIGKREAQLIHAFLKGHQKD